MTKSAVLYHASCSDGFTSAWAAWKALGDSADYIAVQHDEPPPDVFEYDHIYVVDFSYPAEVLLEMMGVEETALGYHTEPVRKLTLLDHHKSAKKDLAPLEGEDIPGLTIEFDMDRSGAMMTWNHFHGKAESPRLVQYVQDRDLWQWKLPSSKEVSTVISTTKHDFEEWDRLSRNLNMNFDAVVDEGSAMLRYAESNINLIAKKPGFTRLEGYLVPCVNNGTWQSELGNVLSRDYPFAVAWFMKNDGGVVYSLRSSAENPNHVDVSEIAKRFGGGGHRHAAGFRASAPPAMVPAPEEE